MLGSTSTSVFFPARSFTVSFILHDQHITPHTVRVRQDPQRESRMT